MRLNYAMPGLLAALVLTLGTGCQKSGPGGSATSLTPTQLSPDTVLRVHWLGKDKLGTLAGAYYLMRVWQLPRSAQLQQQTLAKLSTAPWRWLRGENVDTNAAAALEPLLADVVWNESYLEIRQATNQPAEFVFAIRLDAPHERLWETNLAAVIASLTGLRPTPATDGAFGWSLEKHDPPRRIELTRAGGWTVVAAGPDQNGLLDEVTARIRRDHVPYVPAAPADWLEANVDFPRLAAWLHRDWNLPAGLPKISLAVTGDGGHVLTHATLSFPEPLRLDFQPWTVPTNLIHQPVVGFTAIRGFEPWLAATKMWNALQMGQPPDQLYFWALPGGLYQTYFAAPLPDAAGQVRALTAHLLNQANPWMAARGYVGFASATGANGVTWGNSPSIKPFVVSANADGAGGVAYGGLFPETGSAADAQTNLFYDHPSFPDLLRQISSRTNLVYYDWELTGDRIQSCLYIGQFLSAITRRPPLSLDSPGAGWLKIVMPRLGNSTTAVTLTGANQLTFTRRSTLGLTAAELNLLAAWLESPNR